MQPSAGGEGAGPCTPRGWRSGLGMERAAGRGAAWERVIRPAGLKGSAGRDEGPRAAGASGSRRPAGPGCGGFCMEQAAGGRRERPAPRGAGGSGVWMERAVGWRESGRPAGLGVRGSGWSRPRAVGWDRVQAPRGAGGVGGRDGAEHQQGAVRVGAGLKDGGSEWGPPQAAVWRGSTHPEGQAVLGPGGSGAGVGAGKRLAG